MNIISASRREDMPAFRFPHLLKRYQDFPEAFFVLWTKDPRNLLKSEADILDPKRIALQLTITGLGGTDIEPGVPTPDLVWEAVDALIRKGYQKALITWRFDPVIPEITSPKIASTMADCAQALGITRCMFSFITFDDDVKSRWPGWEKVVPTISRQEKIVKQLHEIMDRRGIQLYGCAQPHLTQWIKPARCIDGPYYASVTGFDFSSDKDGYQRKACGCTESYDIGKYSACFHRCRYCYSHPAGPNDPDPAVEDQLNLF